MNPFIRWSPSRSTRDYGPYPIHIPHLYVCHTPPHITPHITSTHPARSSADLSHTSLPPCTNLSKGQASSVASQAQNDPARTYSCDWTIGVGHSSSLLDTPCPGGLPDILGSSTPCMLVCQVGECFRLQPGRAAGLVTTALGILQTLQCAWQRLVFSKDTRDRVQAGNSIIYWLLRHWSAFRWKGPELLIPTKQGAGRRRVRIDAQPPRLEGRPNGERPRCGDPYPQKEPAELLPRFLLGVDKGATLGHWDIEGSATPDSNNTIPTTTRKTSALGGPSPIPPLSDMEPQCCPPCPQINGIGVVSEGTSGVVGLTVRAQKGEGRAPVTWEATAEGVERVRQSRIRASDSRLVVGEMLADLETAPVPKRCRSAGVTGIGAAASRARLQRAIRRGRGCLAGWSRLS